METLRKVVILHTNDIHSSFQVLPRVAGAIMRLRKFHQQSHVTVVDSGDFIDRINPLTEGSDGQANLEMMDLCGYEVITLGNNEGLTFTKQQLNDLFSVQRGFQVVAANIKETGKDAPPSWMKGSCIQEFDGIRIGFIGVTAAYDEFYRLLGWQVENPLKAVEREADKLRGKVHAIVLLSHLGLKEDMHIAEETSCIDIILGAHTHHVLEKPLLHHQSLLCGCGSMGRFVGELELYFDQEQLQLVQVEGRIHYTDHEMEEEPVRVMLDRLKRDSQIVMEQPVALLRERLPVDWHRDSPLGNLLAAGIRKQTGADIGLINSGQLLTSLMAGSVTRNMLLELCPSPVNTCLVAISGEDIRLALEESLLDEYVYMPLYGNGFRGKQLGGLCIDGMSVVWDADQLPYQKIIHIQVGDVELQPHQQYQVATADMFTFGTGYLSLMKGSDLRYFLPDFLRHVIQRELNDSEAIARSHRPRFQKLSDKGGNQ